MHPLPVHPLNVILAANNQPLPSVEFANYALMYSPGWRAAVAGVTMSLGYWMTVANDNGTMSGTLDAICRGRGSWSGSRARQRSELYWCSCTHVLHRFNTMLAEPNGGISRATRFKTRRKASIFSEKHCNYGSCASLPNVMSGDCLLYYTHQ